MNNLQYIEDNFINKYSNYEKICGAISTDFT